MKTITFNEDDKLFCMQDFSFYERPPAGVEFIIEKDEKGDHVKLIAEGYGAMKDNPYGLPYSYGNGAFFIKQGTFTEFLEGRVNDKEVEYLLT